MNVKKFMHRTKLFSDILYEIFQVESNYRAELNELNLKLNKKIEDQKIKMLKKRSFFIHNDKNHSKGNFSLLNEKRKSTIFSSVSSNCLKRVKKESNIIYDKEENPLIDKLVSESLELILTFYKTKYNIISQEVTKFGKILYQYSSEKKIYDNNEERYSLHDVNKIFDTNLSKLSSSKQDYYHVMNDFEVYFYNEENVVEVKDKINNENNNTIKVKKKKKEKNKIKEKELEEKIKKVIDLRESYKEAIDNVNNSKREYLIKLNEVSSEVQEFNINENDMLLKIFTLFDENIKLLANETKNYTMLYEHNQKIVQDLNIEYGNNLLFDDKIKKIYQYEEYIPEHTDTKNQKDLLMIQKMNKMIGLEIDKINNLSDDIKYNNTINTGNNINENIKNENDDLVFVLILEKFIGDDGDKLTDNEIKKMKLFLNDEKYIKSFLLKLNKQRNNSKLLKQKKKFDNLVIFFNYVFSKLPFNNPQNHELVKLLMILGETFFYKENNIKTYVNSLVKLPNEIKDVDFWIAYIDIEIQNEYEKCKKINNSQIEYIVLLSNTTHFKEYLKDKEKIHQIMEHYTNIYKFDNNEINTMQGQVK